MFAVVLGVAQQAVCESPLLPALAAPGDPASWQVMGLPKQKIPYTRFSDAEVAGHRAIRIEADNAYGNLVHTTRVLNPPHTLSWQWRIETLNSAADLRHKNTDDTSLKVCVFFDLDLKNIPFFERQLLRLARQRSATPLPGATVCYVWDPTLPEGTTLANAYTNRVRYIVAAQGGEAAEWRSVNRDIAVDFRRLFGEESREIPPLIGIGIGADSDNTHQRSVGYVADLVLAP
ncbi:MAG: DUF3047 domain-containing protein [Gammaproteobacteria bacterium]